MTTLPKAVKDWTAEDFASAFDEYNAFDRARRQIEGIPAEPETTNPWRREEG